ncbi:MAG: endonuclease III [Spirochaetia bacterium]|jgi:endonuclease-3
MSRAGAIPWRAIMDAMARRLDASHAFQQLPSVSAVARVNSDPFRVLAATMISLRTKDEVTSRSSQALLSRAPSPSALAALPESRIARLIYPAGFYRTKAKNLRAAARILVAEHHEKVPPEMDRLLALPGVGRKTANLVRNLGFGLPGICVDTHVHRISNRMGWVSTRTPEQTEQALMGILPRRYWIGINELLVRYGQAVCTPLSPRCSTCPAARENPRKARGDKRMRQERGDKRMRQERRAWCARVGVERSR